MAVRAFASGVLGWVVPGIVALPLAWTHESSGGEAVILAGAAWLLLLGPIGCAIAGWYAARVGGQAREVALAFWVGLAGIAVAVVAVMAVDGLVSVLTIGPAAFVLVLPLVVGFSVGFALRATFYRRAGG